MKTELSMSVEDLTSGRAQIIDDDDDDHDDHDDSDKINDAEGMDPERLKAFNVSVFTFSPDRPESDSDAPPISCLLSATPTPCFCPSPLRCLCVCSWMRI